MAALKPTSTIAASLLLVFGLFGNCGCKDVAPGISDHLYCEACVATITELVKLTSKKTSDPRDLVITEALENICKPYNFVKYDYSPPKTVKACQLLLEKHEEEIETVLAKRSQNLEKVICHDISKACLGVDRSKKPENLGDVDLSMNGKTGKAEKVFDVDPKTGKATNSKENAIGEGKTLSKKDRKNKKVEKEKSKAKKADEKKKNVGGADFFQLDINDPNSMNKVMAQIQNAAQQHTNDFYRKQEEEETEKEEEEEQKRKTDGKDEL